MYKIEVTERCGTQDVLRMNHILLHFIHTDSKFAYNKIMDHILDINLVYMTKQSAIL